jgi:hypothetical protein
MYQERYCNIFQPTGPRTGRKNPKIERAGTGKERKKNFTAENAKDTEERDHEIRLCVDVFFAVNEVFKIKIIAR